MGSIGLLSRGTDRRDVETGLVLSVQHCKFAIEVEPNPWLSEKPGASRIRTQNCDKKARERRAKDTPRRNGP